MQACSRPLGMGGVLADKNEAQRGLQAALERFSGPSRVSIGSFPPSNTGAAEFPVNELPQPTCDPWSGVEEAGSLLERLTGKLHPGWDFISQQLYLQAKGFGEPINNSQIATRICRHWTAAVGLLLFSLFSDRRC